MYGHLYFSILHHFIFNQVRLCGFRPQIQVCETSRFIFLRKQLFAKAMFFSEKRIVEILISYSKYKYNLREFHEKLVKFKIARTGNLQRNNAEGIHDEKFSRNFSFISEWLSFASAFVCSHQANISSLPKRRNWTKNWSVSRNWISNVSLEPYHFQD